MPDNRNEKERKAARSALKKAYRKKNRRAYAAVNFIGIPVTVILIAACVISIISDKVELNEKQQELEVLRAKAEELEVENANYESILNEEDERTYMERIAIEQHGYAYPNERRFSDTSRN